MKNLFMLPEGGDTTHRFEENLRAFLGVTSATTVPMCRTGIYLAVKHLIHSKQDVVMSPYTIADVVNMVILAGGRPVFADIERSTCNISLESVKSLIHVNTGAVLVTHLHGFPARIQEICALCESMGVPVIEDAAQAFGARVKGQRLGTYADVGVYSFGMYKNINTWYGGAITCRDPELFAAIKGELDSFALQRKAFLMKRMLQGLTTDIATHPLVFRLCTYWIFRFGRLYDIKWINRFVETELDLSRRESIPETYVGNMTEAQRQLGLRQLDHIDHDNQIRFQKASQYRQGLDGIDTIALASSDSPDAIYTYFPIQHGSGPEDRHRLLLHLARRGCDVGPQHLKNCADLPAFKDFYRDCPNARKVAESVVLLPTYPAYPDRDIAHIVAVLRDYLSGLSA